MTDEDRLWREAATGDENAHRRLAEIVYPIIRRQLTWLGAPSQDLDDLCQATYVSIRGYMRANKGATPDFLKTWVKWRALGILSDYRKKKLPTYYDDPPELTTSESPSRRALSAELLEAVEECGREIEKDRKLIALRYIQGKSVRDAAEICGLTPENAAVRIFRALRKLRKCLEKAGFNPPDLNEL